MMSVWSKTVMGIGYLALLAGFGWAFYLAVHCSNHHGIC